MIRSVLLLSLSVFFLYNGEARPSFMQGEKAEVCFGKNIEKDTFQKGARLFNDREYLLAECPPELNRYVFLRGSIMGIRGRVSAPGVLTVLTPPPEIPTSASMAANLESAGFAWIKSAKLFQLFGKAERDQVRIYQKRMKEGEFFSFNKWVIILGCRGSSSFSTKLFGKEETLYNNIVSMDDPRDRTDMTAFKTDPLPVPYLEHPPAVIPVDIGRQLFVDDFLIAQTTLTRTWHKAQKDVRNPVLKPETPLECGQSNGHCPMAAPFSGGVWFDGSDNMFKAWYSAGWFDGTAYAYSTNGIDWIRPDLKVQPGSNRVIPAAGTRDSAAVVMDPDTPIGGPRFKMLLWGRPKGGMLHVSTNGVDWSKGVYWGNTGDRSTIFYNPFRKKWVYSIRSGWASRSREYAEASDFLGGAGLENRVCWLRADKLDLPGKSFFYAFPERDGKIFTPCLYNFDAVAYESLMVGVFTIMTGPENNFCMEEGVPKMTELHLGFSRDGFHWSRPSDRTPFIPAGREAGTWDRAYLHSNAALCLVVNDELWFYYTGFAGDPARKTEKSAAKNGMYANASMGIARLRRDGFASMDAGKEGGELVTRPVTFRKGEKLFVNVDAQGGSLKAEVLDEQNNPVKGFTLDRCKTVAVDRTRQEISWEGDSSLRSLCGKTVRFRFILSNASLYSFWVGDAAGKSGGYLAGGAPGYRTLLDK